MWCTAKCARRSGHWGRCAGHLRCSCCAASVARHRNSFSHLRRLALSHGHTPFDRVRTAMSLVPVVTGGLTDVVQP
eukprot:667882-Prymnesium_polylepis.1